MEALQRAGRVLSELRLHSTSTRPRAFHHAATAVRVGHHRHQPVRVHAFPSVRSSRQHLCWWRRLALVMLGRDVLEHSRALLVVLAVGVGSVGIALLGCCIERKLALPMEAADTDGAASKSSHTEHCFYRGSLMSRVLSSLLLLLPTISW